MQVHLLAVRDGELSWRHGLVRHAVWATVLPPQRQALSRAAAELLLSGGTDESQAAAAELLSTGGDVDRAADVWLRLSDSAVARGALRTAAELLQRAADTGRRPAAAAVRRVELLTLLGRAAEALQAGRSALDVSRGDEHAELCLRLARAAVAAGEWAAADDFVALAGRADQPGSLIVLADSAHGAGAHRGRGAACAGRGGAGSGRPGCRRALRRAVLPGPHPAAERPVPCPRGVRRGGAGGQ